MCHFSFFRERIRIIMKKEEKTSNARFGLSNYGSSQVDQVDACLGARPVVDRLTQKSSKRSGGRQQACHYRATNMDLR